MMTSAKLTITDVDQRQTALDPTRSFIVQAPAGSGKTELLTQRFLNLLAHAVNAPEEIIAITFTRKAAAEMRMRIINALIEGTSAAAIAARERDKQMNWQLTNHANRLRIMTIDALCNYLVQQMPIKANCGQLIISDDPFQLYALAVQNLILQHAQNSPYTDALKKLLWHLDNDISRLSNLCIDILANRDQWLPHVFGLDATQTLEQGLANVVTDQLQKCINAIPANCQQEIWALIQFAAENVSNENLQACRELKHFPTAEITYAQHWQAIAQLFLNKSGQWRQKFTIKEGFPAPSSTTNKEDKLKYTDYKQRLQQCLAKLQEDEYIRECLAGLLTVPATQYNADQTAVIKALSILLPVLVAELQLIFAQENKVDFTEITLRALQALGDQDNPTDLALALDYQIRHLLVDEFQDTSITQLRLIERLIAGWSAGENRSLFLVGDPMQSIYRFRKAEVGLFLQVQKYGIGNILPETLILSTNFRATENLVTWFNTSFSKIFPTHADPALGAIAYSPSQALPGSQAEQAVFTHYVANDYIVEAQNVIQVLKNTWQQNPQAKVAILVRARQHLKDILLALHHANIPYRSVDMAMLQDHPAVQDLFSLTRALMHPADRIAWLAILRAPWCGLTLQDMHSVVSHDHHITVWDALLQFNVTSLTEDGQKRYEYFMQVMQDAMAQRGRLSLGAWVEKTWINLQGPACLSHPQDLLSVNAYFKLLYSLAFDVDMAWLQKRLAQLTMPTDPNPAIQLDVMTIHKAKGLEFDVVILPGLAKITRPDSMKLFLWAERINHHGQSDLLVAPIKSYIEKFDPIYFYLKSEEDKKAQYELQRLLYVAATRAKQILHLFIPTSINTPEKNTLLAQLWPVIAQEMQLQQRERGDNIFTPATPFFAAPLQRISQQAIPTVDREKISGVVSPEISNNTKLLQALMPSAERYLITLLPELLHKVALANIKVWQDNSIEQFQAWIKIRLLQMGWQLEAINEGIDLAVQCLKNIFHDPRGQWLMHQQHQEVRHLYGLHGIVDSQLVRLTVDKTFIDNDNRRWIVNYRISDKADTTKQQRQLEKFAAMLKQQEQRDIYLGLYFPLTTEWLEWPFVQE